MTKIKVVGVGGSGCNAVTRMMKDRVKGVELIALNTDVQDLKAAKADTKLRIGAKVTQGLGTGMNPEIGKKAALESKEQISEVVAGSDMVFITCGLGGGTGSGASPVVAEAAKEKGALTLAVVTKPFSFEGLLRARVADGAVRRLKEKVDCLITVKNDRLLEVLDPKVSISSAFWAADDVLRQAVSGISDLVFLPGIINVDFADIKSVMQDSGSALFGVGRAKGENRAEQAARLAINSPLLDSSCRGAKGVLFNVSGGKDLALSEIEEVAEFIAKEVNQQARIIFGAVYDHSLPKGEIKATVIATGF